MEVFAVVLIPGILALLFFLMPFLDRKLERRPWRRPIPLLSVAIVLVGIIFLGFKSHLDDLNDHNIAVQLAFQDKQAEDYTKAPFIPQLESAGGQSLSSEPVSPLVAKGRGIFTAKGCSGCHGTGGTGTAQAPSLVGIMAKYPLPQITELLRHPNAKMLAGHMPSFDMPTPEMAALFSYLGSLGQGSGSTPEPTSAAVSPAAADGSGPATPDTETAHSAAAPGKGATGTSPVGAAGEKMFQAQACARCHGTAGAGAGKIPALGGLVAKSSDAQVAKLIQAPNATMKAGGMPPFVASPKDVTSMVAYLRSLAPGKTVQPQTKAQETSATTPAQNGPAAVATPAAKPNTESATAAEPASAKAQSASSNLATSAGRSIFLANGCLACHGKDAQGTHFAPSLIGITKKYPPAQLTDLLHHPKKEMRAGGMPAVTVNDAQMKQLVTYLSNLGAVPAKESPATASAPQPAPGQPATRAASGNSASPAAAAKEATVVPLSADAVRGKALFEHNRCETCHGADGLNGTVAAPGLAGMASVLPASVLDNLLQHHSTQMKNGNMPPTNMSPNTRKAVVAYIRSMPSPPDAQ
jgi:mono/diheme cytochrome c family protein